MIILSSSHHHHITITSSSHRHCYRHHRQDWFVWTRTRSRIPCTSSCGSNWNKRCLLHQTRLWMSTICQQVHSRYPLLHIHTLHIHNRHNACVRCGILTTWLGSFAHLFANFFYFLLDFVVIAVVVCVVCGRSPLVSFRFVSFLLVSSLPNLSSRLILFHLVSQNGRDVWRIAWASMWPVTPKVPFKTFIGPLEPSGKNPYEPKPTELFLFV